MSDKKYRLNIAKEIKPNDDAFHGSIKRLSLEWWYFDAIFTNGYSIHVGCKTNSKKKRGLISPIIEIYKDGKIQSIVKKWFRFKNFETSKEIPLVKLFNKPLIEFDEERYKKTGEWAYRINIKIKDCWAKLTFTGLSKGFKIETERESWTVALPRAKVTGEICLHGKTIDVEGIGYHDHNWNYTLLTALDYGKAWYWGKINSNNFDVIFANIIKSSKNSEILAVIVDGNKRFFNIRPENIEFKKERFIRNNRKKIPTSFKLKIDEVVDNVPIKVDINMDGSGFHYNRVLIAPYWRYHIKTSGNILVGPVKDVLDNINIMEFLSFS
jgi:hypothetical protein